MPQTFSPVVNFSTPYTKPRYVYFIRCTCTGRIKIGIANDPVKRLHGLQALCPTTLEITAVIKGGLKKEQELHIRFKEERLHGEWFEPRAALASYLKRLGNQRSDLADIHKADEEKHRKKVNDVEEHYKRMAKHWSPGMIACAKALEI